MSGPKGGAYYVVETAAQREARMLRDARADYAAAESAWQSAIAQVAAVGAVTGQHVSVTRPSPVTAEADAASYMRAATELRAASTAAAEAAVSTRERDATRRHFAQMARMMEAIAAQKPTDVSEAVRRSRWHANQSTQAEQTVTPAATVDRSAIAQRVQRRLEALATITHDPSRVESLVDDIGRSASPSRVDLLLSELDYLVTEARARARREEQIDQARGSLKAMYARIADLTDPAAQVTRQRIADLIHTRATEIPEDLARMVDEVIAFADAEADRQRVVEVMQAALERLGYHTGPSFSTDLTARGTAFARNGASRYGVKIRLESGATRFTAQAVKSDAVLSSASEDTAAERRFCNDFDDLVEFARRDGVAMDVDIRTAAGAVGVQQVSDATLISVSRPTPAAGKVKPTGAREMKR